MESLQMFACFRSQHHSILYTLSQEAVTAEQKSLGGKVETLLSWLRETEAQMDGGMAKTEKMDKAEKNDNRDQLTQQLNVCKVRRAF